MADVLYDVYENYDAAQSYYDTAMHVLPWNIPTTTRYASVHYLLTSLVEFTRIIACNDSLIMVADMDSTARLAYNRPKD